MQTYAITAEVESPGSNGAFGPTFEVATTTFSRAPSLSLFEAVRSDAEASTVTVRYKLSEVSCWAIRSHSRHSAGETFGWINAREPAKGNEWDSVQ